MSWVFFKNQDMTEYNIDEKLSFGVSFSGPLGVELGSGFNEYGVKEYDDGSIDVIFAAMEPGLRKGLRITEDFLDGVARNFSEELPLQLDHSNGQMANVGSVREVKFTDGFLRVLGHVPNTGNSVRTDVIADFTHDPPAISDGSVGFSNDYRIERNDDGEPEFVEASMSEFSLTPFPAGYGSSGGLSPQFADAAREAGVFSHETDTGSGGRSRVKGTVRAKIYDTRF